MTDKTTKILSFILVAIAVVLAVASSWNDSLIVDEIPHIGAGYSYVAKQDLRLNPEHPPLAKDLAGLPLIFLKLKQDVFQTKQWLTDVNDQWEFGRKLIYNSGNDANLIGHFAKLPVLLFFILAGLFIFKWGKKLYGNKGALIALLLFSFSPTVLAHARFVTTDIPALFGVIFGTYFFVSYLQSPTKKNFWLASIAFGIALLTKFSTFLLVPYFLILALTYGLVHGKAIRHILSTILILIVGVLIIVWPVYLLNGHNYPSERQKADTVSLLKSYGNRLATNSVIWASDKPGVRALASYGLGLLMVNQRATGGNTTYFLGEVSKIGWRTYFPIVYFIKEPLAWWGLAIIALIAIMAQMLKCRYVDIKNFPKNYFTEFAMLLWLLIYWSVSIKSTLNIGVRHLLPTYPFTILLVSGQIGKILENFKKITKSLIFISGFLVFFLMTWYVMESIKVYPYYLTYFNQVVGGPEGGYKYVVDSNLDWGQDLKRFSQWVKENNIAKIELDYFGWADQSYYLGNSFEWLTAQKYKNAEDFRARNDTNGWLAVSATFLQGSEKYNWLKAREPETIIGHSIFVYQVK